MRHLFILFLTFTSATVVCGASLSGGLSSGEIDRVVEVIGVGSTTRIMRSAEAYESFPGIKLGMEIILVPSHNLNSLGDQTGTMAGAHPVPRFHIAKGLFADLELSLIFFPFSIANSIGTLGATLKWAFFEEKQNWLHGAVFFSYTSISAFDRSFSGNNIELGGLLSKDFVRLKPYFGGGLIFARGSVARAYARSSQNSGSHSTLHAFLGAELEFPINVSFQLDLFNLSPAGSLFLGKKF